MVRLDPGDDVACVRALTALHDLAAGRVVCHASPGAPWPVLVRCLLGALGKHPAAATRERWTGHAAALLTVWLRAETVRHLVVLRAHLLAPEVLVRLAELGAAAGVTVWAVWHRPTPPPDTMAVPWTHAAAVIRRCTGRPTGGNLTVAPDPDRTYRRAVAAARAEARAWLTRPGRGHAGSPIPAVRWPRSCSG